MTFREKSLHNRLNFNDFCVIVLLIAISVVLSFYYQSNQIISGDQTQMLLKGFKGAIEGIYLPYGNEASTVGNIPGSLSSLVVGLPLEFWFSPYSIVSFLCIIRIIGALIFINALSQIFSPKTVVIGAAFYLINPWFLYDSLIYNPSYLSLGAALCLNMLIRLRRDSQHKASATSTVICSILLMLSIGWCVQFHFSWPVLVALCGLLWLRRSIKVSYIGIVIGILLVLASLYPYFQEVMVNKAIISNPEEYAKDRYFGYGLVHVYPLFKALLYWLRFGSLLITNKAIVPESFGDGMLFEILRYAYIGFTQAIGVITVIISAIASYFLIVKVRYSGSKKIYFVKELSICSILAILLAAAAATLVLNYWQIIIMFCFALLPVLVLIEKKPRIKKSLIIFFSVYMILINIIAATNSAKFNYRYSLSDQVVRFCVSNYSKEQCHADLDLVPNVTTSIQDATTPSYKNTRLTTSPDVVNKQGSNSGTDKSSEEKIKEDLKSNTNLNTQHSSPATMDKQELVIKEDGQQGTSGYIQINN